MTYAEATKKHKGDNLKDKDFESRPRMYATNTAKCRVASFKLYLEKRNKNNNKFFQRVSVSEFYVSCNSISVICVSAQMCRRTEEVVPTVGLPTP